MGIMDASFLRRLSQRERMILLVGGGVLLLLGVWGLAQAADWYGMRMRAMERQIRDKEAAQASLARIQQDYNDLQSQLKEIEARIAKDKGSFSLLSFLESLAGNLGMRSSIAYMRPQPPTEVEGFRELGVEIKIQNITLEQAVRLLSSLEEAPHLIRVKQLQMRTRFADPRYLDATILAVTYEEI